MARPRLLDLFSGAGGAAVGYHRAGFDVVGVDINPQPRYPFEHHVADAMTFPLDGFDAIHASPPCQEHSTLRGMWNAKDHGTAWMLDATRQRLHAWGGPYVIENVMGADMPDSLMLCGASFGLTVDGYHLRRHRRFQSNVFMIGPGCGCFLPALGVYGNGGTGRHARGTKATIAQARAIMDIDWMTTKEISQAIPPAYTQFIGEYLLEAVYVRA
jgi:DNA (cytosine-5)-methyltransferase 1